jgi:hypothetical protein
MWQRIQTVFLLIVIISLILSIFYPLWSITETSGKVHQLFPLHYTQVENGVRQTLYFPYTITAIFIIAAATLAIISIGKYRNRLLQMKLGALNSLFMAAAIASAVYFSSDFVKTFQGGRYGFGLWLPGIAVIANLIANRFIRRDERLVRDSGRLR